MSQTFTINGTGYPFPDTGDENWGAQVTAWASAATTGLLQKAGGTFTLTANVNFGASFGLLSAYFASRGTVATSGILRLANLEAVSWRNAANGGNLPLAVNASDELTYNGTAIVPSTGIFPTTSGGTGLGTYTAGDTIYYASGTAFTKLAIGAANRIYTSTGTAPQWVASLLTSQGGTGLTSYTAGDMVYYAAGTLLSKLAIGASNTVLQSNGSIPVWNSTLTLSGGLSVTTGAFSSVVGILGGNNSSIALWINAASLVSSSTDQYGVISQPVSSSSATVSIAAFYGGCNTAASAFTCALRAQFYVANPSKGAGSTITRDVGIYVGSQSEGGTGNAAICDNVAFTGTYFLNSTTTNPSLFSGVTQFAAGLRTKVSTANTSNPPTEAQLISAFGTAATVGSGFIAIVDDNGGHTAEYIVWSDGTKYFYATGTVAA